MEGGRLWRLALKAWPKRLGLGAWSFPAWRVQARGKGMQVRLADATLQLEPYHLRGEATTPLSRAPGLGWVASQPARPASQPAVFTAAVSSGSETCPRFQVILQ